MRRPRRVAASPLPSLSPALARRARRARVALLAGGGRATSRSSTSAPGRCCASSRCPGASTAVAIARDGRVGYAAGGGQVAGARPARALGDRARPWPRAGRRAGRDDDAAAGAADARRGDRRAAGAGRAGRRRWRSRRAAGRSTPRPGPRCTPWTRGRSRRPAASSCTATALDLAVAPGGTQGAATLRGGRVAVLDLHGPRLLRRVKVKGASGVAFAGGRAWVSTTRGPPADAPARGEEGDQGHQGAPRRSSGRIAVAPDGLHLAVGPGVGRREGRDRRPGAAGRPRLPDRAPARPRRPTRPTAARVYLAGGAAVSLVSAFGHARTGTLPLRGDRRSPSSRGSRSRSAPTVRTP